MFQPGEEFEVGERLVLELEVKRTAFELVALFLDLGLDLVDGYVVLRILFLLGGWYGPSYGFSSERLARPRIPGRPEEAEPSTDDPTARRTEDCFALALRTWFVLSSPFHRSARDPVGRNVRTAGRLHGYPAFTVEERRNPGTGRVPPAT